ncbi:mycofactocin system FadH/OYE family oxidoreductase 2 [Rhodococcus qingshengii]|jgi:2,4-dienoyl-CoA reductase (NADPH2)|uniref:mycofactocin system FadH/OYE family oxidoreductase 2 n=1 Tax=Rhodococcus TaxID=1827 RepID=UPI00067E8F3E|nr:MULTISPECIES: mycofactocin system FadH/OYE family oxidoreductase 2 [Rhodococcus]AUS31256.1 mycofactocin system FadH/OYE family oxidoreductase 2 [Rhodococcus qingshengii]MBQ7804463.1 mycofactocin system FadH/OYE family oxidoreductase 2 [Rhodococcus sp. (in: high G+C Gram-positive bacteria)]MCC4303725.1 mycofactocin system FadH/OYE family oxidoreductase 2 [Rhodococcus sp. 3-2]MDI9945699.1 mycofactocin system FadH/OYE family oxidoreductase 2 [Rhodococcus sp. IEGM 1302]MDJ0489442.1 mycofactocin
MTPYPRLFAPLRLGNLTLRNRVVFSAHLTNYAENGLPTEQHASYYEARARGGAGLIITEEHSTHPSDRPYEKMIAGYRPEAIEGYRRITDAVHAHGSSILAQINHNGGQGAGTYSRSPLLAPSAVADPLFREVPKAVDAADIAEILAGFALVARNCVAGGFDGVELQASQSSIVRAFLAPSTNLRTDRYGGCVAHRARFLLEVLGVLRKAIGPDRVLGVRLSGHEGTRGGIELSDAVATAQLIEADGHVDYINTTVGMATETLHLVEASMAVPTGYANFVPSAIREVIDLPVVGVGRFKTPEQAEAALEDGVCDLVGVVRGQIADPDFVNKARAGQSSQVRTCLSCNQECVGRMGLGRWLGCTENPRAGRESVPLPMPRRRGRTVVVVGGGPAGLQAAATAAQRGHAVTLFERERRLGGQILTASVVPARRELADLVRNLESECRRSGVTIELDAGADLAIMKERAPEVVVIATGARPVRPAWAGGSERVVGVRDVLDGKILPSGTVLVYDELGFHQGTSVAEFLADRGCAVTIATNGMVVAQDLSITLDFEGWNRRAFEKSIGQRTDLMVTSVSAGASPLVSLVHLPTGVTEEVAVDWVVFATQQEPVDELWNTLQGSCFEKFRIGDALSPRRSHAAVIEGHRAALAI